VLGGFLLVGGADLGSWLTNKAMAGIPSMAFYLFINSFEVLIALIQAYIFTILSSIFVGMMLSHEH
jgi:F0F1-type ATP synthase membrane subunit a